MNVWRAPHLPRTLVAVGGAVLGAALLAACSGGSANSGTSTPSSTSTAATPTGAAGGRRGAAAPAAFGTAAAVSPGSLEVQNSRTGQVTVKYTTNTKFSQAKNVAKSALAAGDCVSAIGAPPQQGGTSTTPSSGPTRTARPTAFTATTVTISKPVNGTCVGSFGGNGRRPSGAPSAFPRRSGLPTGARRSGAPRPAGDFGEFATGKVSSLAGSAILVQATGRGTTTTHADTITVTSSTRYVETASATSAALKVGECITASGKADSTGAVTATRIGISSPGADGCTTGFGRRGSAGRSGSGG